MAREEHDLDMDFDFAKGRRKTPEEIAEFNRRTKCSPRNQSAKRATEIEEEIETRLRDAFKSRLTSR